jgi:hypothetical protein
MELHFTINVLMMKLLALNDVGIQPLLLRVGCHVCFVHLYYSPGSGGGGGSLNAATVRNGVRTPGLYILRIVLATYPRGKKIETMQQPAVNSLKIFVERI